MPRFSRIFLLSCLLAGCGGGAQDGALEVAYIGDAATLFSSDRELTPGAQVMRSAQRQGLVRFNEAGEVVPALAERWIVTDDGESYIFRLNDIVLANGDRVPATVIADALEAEMRRLDGTALGLDLSKVRDIRAMTGRVVEIRLHRPMPGFLNLLAQAELGISLREGETGPMTAVIDDGTAILEAIPPEQRGFAPQEDWFEQTRRVQVTPMAASAAAQAFAQGDVDLLMGGRLETLPLAITGALSRGTVRLDPAIGLFGIDVMEPSGFLATAPNRESLALAIDRSTLMQNFSLGGWSGTSRIVPAGLPGESGTVPPRWPDLTFDQRRSIAAQRVAQYESGTGEQVSLSIAMPQGPGADRLFGALARDFAAIGIDLERVRVADDADLRLRDTVARYAGARWFLNQFNCRVSPRVCSKDADILVALSIQATTSAEEAGYLTEAEQVLTDTNLYIPLGPPVRWSQVRAGVQGYAENAWAFHPLFPLSRAPI